MSGIDEPGTPPDVPEEYAETYRDAYLRALAEQEGASEVAPIDDLLESAPVLEHRRSPWVLVGVVGLGAAVLVAAAFGIGQLLADDSDGPEAGTPAPVVTPLPTTALPTGSAEEPAEEPSEEPSATASGSAEAYDGTVVPVTPEEVEATCTSAPGVDAAGDPVEYEASNTVDADDSTAWRCDGRAVGVTLTFELPAGTELGEVGLIPGYAKTDAKSGADRYAENNRITRVRWRFDDGTEVEQELDPSPSNRSVQTVRVPRTEAAEVTLEILETTRGPRNTTAISTVTFGAAS